MKDDNDNIKSRFSVFADFFMESESLRNFASFVLYILAVFIVWKGFECSCSFPATTNLLLFFSVLIGTLIASIISAGIAMRLAVTKVCPRCKENRAIIERNEIEYSEEVPDAIRTVDGGKPWDYNKEHLIREKHVRIIECKYCDFYLKKNSHWVERWEEYER